jgi:hypothetical protein
MKVDQTGNVVKGTCSRDSCPGMSDKCTDADLGNLFGKCVTNEERKKVEEGKCACQRSPCIDSPRGG